MKNVLLALYLAVIMYLPGCAQKVIDMNVAVFIYDGVEVLDFSGPAEVFAVSRGTDEEGTLRSKFNVYTVATSKDPIVSQGFLDIVPDYSIATCPRPDIIVLPGGDTGASRKDDNVIQWIKANADETQIIMSVCTGAFLMGDAGLLDGKTATTWHGRIDRLKADFPETEVLAGVRFVDNGNILTTAGVSAGIDGALHLVSRILGEASAEAAAAYMEYDKWQREDGFVVKTQ